MLSSFTKPETSRPDTQQNKQSIINQSIKHIC